MPSVTQPSPKNDGSPIVSIAGGLLLIQLGILDAVLGLGIVSVAICGVTVPGCQLGLAGELVLIPFEFLSLNLTLYAAQMATSGSTNHDPLPLLHATFPDLFAIQSMTASCNKPTGSVLPAHFYVTRRRSTSWVRFLLLRSSAILA